MCRAALSGVVGAVHSADARRVLEEELRLAPVEFIVYEWFTEGSRARRLGTRRWPSTTARETLALCAARDARAGKGEDLSAMTIGTEHRYIVRDDDILGGEPIVVGTRVPVRAVVELWRLGAAPEEIPTHLPHLTLAQVFDALSFYADHQDEIQRYSDRNQVPDDIAHPRARPDA
jgi:uncharacterized protein (DUF433 family)